MQENKGSVVRKNGIWCSGLMSQNFKYLPATKRSFLAKELKSGPRMGVSTGNSEAWWKFLANLGLHFCKQLRIWSE